LFEDGYFFNLPYMDPDVAEEINSPTTPTPPNLGGVGVKFVTPSPTSLGGVGVQWDAEVRHI
jgi:hypothetical protein